jgi:hypothetical protein
MRKVERNIVKPPNQELQGLSATRSAAPRAGVPESRGSNSSLFAGDPGGTADLTRRPSPVAPLSQRFNVDLAQMPQPPAACEPGKGAVPVNPFLAAGPGLARAVPTDDDAGQTLRDPSTFPHRI